MSNLRDAMGLRVPYGRHGSQYQTEYEPATSTIWGYFNPRGSACFSLGLLKDVRAHDAALAAADGRVEVEGAAQPVDYYVCGSRVPRVFNLGGDLALFVLLIKARDREALAHYARLCIDNMHARLEGYGSRTLVTISMLEGDALGGGLECALASDFVIAEEGAQLGLPEILFNLFPGMGAVSLLSRRIGPRAARELILSGRVMSAREAHVAGLVDVLCPNGRAHSTVQEWIARNARRRGGTQALMRAMRAANPVSRAELDAIADAWVDAAFRLEDKDLKMMGRIVRSQMRRLETGEAGDIGAQALAEEAACLA